MGINLYYEEGKNFPSGRVFPLFGNPSRTVLAKLLVFSLVNLALFVLILQDQPPLLGRRARRET